MTLDEIRETKRMTSAELVEYHNKGAEPMRILLAEKRREREANNKKVTIQ